MSTLFNIPAKPQEHKQPNNVQRKALSILLNGGYAWDCGRFGARFYDADGHVLLKLHQRSFYIVSDYLRPDRKRKNCFVADKRIIRKLHGNHAVKKMYRASTKKNCKQFKVGDNVKYQFVLEYRGTVTVDAKVLQIYPAIYDKSAKWELSIEFSDMGDTVIHHGVNIDSPFIKN